MRHTVCTTHMFLGRIFINIAGKTRLCGVVAEVTCWSYVQYYVTTAFYGLPLLELLARVTFWSYVLGLRNESAKWERERERIC